MSEITIILTYKKYLKFNLATECERTAYNLQLIGIREWPGEQNLIHYISNFYAIGYLFVFILQVQGSTHAPAILIQCIAVLINRRFPRDI